MSNTSSFELVAHFAPSTPRSAESRRLRLMVWMFAAIVVCMLGFAWYSISLLSAARAYVAGEGMWSKAQKEAVYALWRYTRFRAESDFQTYLAAIAITRGDQQARVEMEKAEPDLRLAYEGLLRGRNHPDDIEGMVRLFRNFRHMEPIDRVVEVWAQADALMDKLIEVGNNIRNDALGGMLEDGGVQQYIQELHRINQQLTPLEDEFSHLLGLASRKTEVLLLFAMSAAAAVMLAAAFAFSRRMVKKNEQVQTVLLESENQLRSLLQFAPLPIIVSRIADQTMVYANDRALSQLKISGASLGQQKSQDFYVDRGDREQLIEALRGDGSVRDWEIQLKDAQGRAFWVLMSSQRIVYLGEQCLLTALNNIDERKRAQDDLRHRAFHDELTGLPNRAMFMDSLVRALGRMQRRNGMFSVLFLDLDRFKVVNDTLGHDAGDRLLQMVATRIKTGVRDADLLARLGGDEFVILIEDHGSPSEVALVAQKVLDSMERAYLLDDREVNLTASIGISVYPQDGTDVTALVKNADIAMYQAKELGRNNYQFYTASQNQMTLKRLDLESRLGRAIERDEFALHYQPVVDLATEAVVGAEALLRWHDPEHGLVAPGDFIPLAEETGAILPIGQWVLDHACAQAAMWGRGGMPLAVAVNISQRQFAHRDFAANLRGTLQRTTLQPGALHLEITETMVMRDHVSSEAVLAALGELGVGVAIDDFGTGYSSLSQMKRIPANFIKIDRSFVEDCPDDAGSVAIVRAIVAMAHSLKLKVIAEGVETEAQLRLLVEMDCDMAQGFLFSPPVPAEQLSALRVNGGFIRERFSWRHRTATLKSVSGTD
jgi:diguanylate cyclase (GGDEF)-like protein/PAS domain S-box-containing protein